MLFAELEGHSLELANVATDAIVQIRGHVLARLALARVPDRLEVDLAGDEAHDVSRKLLQCLHSKLTFRG